MEVGAPTETLSEFYDAHCCHEDLAPMYCHSRRAVGAAPGLECGLKNIEKIHGIP
jgi:hypothetical protein